MPRSLNVMSMLKVLAQTARLTNMPRKHQKVVIGKSTMFPGIEKIVDAETVSGLIILLKNVQSFGIVNYGLTSSKKRCTRASGIAVQDGHDDDFSDEEVPAGERNTVSKVNVTKQCYKLCGIESFSERKKRSKRQAQNRVLDKLLTARVALQKLL